MKDVVIAIVDDDESTRSALAALMRTKGFSVIEYSSAEEFLATQSHIASSCIITDFQMPGLSGIELKHRLDAVNSKVPVIMITARVEAQLHTEALASGVFCLLRKPFRASTLIKNVERAVAS